MLRTGHTDCHASRDLQAVGGVYVQTGDLLGRFSIYPQQLDDQLCLVARRGSNHPVLHPEQTQRENDNQNSLVQIKNGWYGNAAETAQQIKKFQMQFSPNENLSDMKCLYIMYMYNVMSKSFIHLIFRWTTAACLLVGNYIGKTKIKLELVFSIQRPQVQGGH